MTRQVFGQSEELHAVGDGQQRLAAVVDDVDDPPERVHRQPGRVGSGPRGGQHVGRPGGIVPERDRGEGPHEHRARVAHPGRHGRGVASLDLEMLGRVGVDDRQALLHVANQHHRGLRAGQSGAHTIGVPRHPDHTLDVTLVLDAVHRVDPAVVIITTPNNPTGTTTPVEVVRQVLGGTDAIVVVDEAYLEFARDPQATALTLLADHGNLVVSRTMSKAFAFAGGRLGYLAANPAVVDAMRIVRLPYHLSGPTQALAAVALANADEMLGQVDVLRRVRDEALTRLPESGVEVVPSDANFVLFGRFADRHDVWGRLLERGVLVRETGPAGFLRVSAGTPHEMERFYAALAEVLTEGAPRMEE